MKQKVVIRCEGSGEVIDIPGATSKPKTKVRSTYLLFKTMPMSPQG